MTDLDRSDFLFRTVTLSTAAVVVILVVFLVVAALSPELNVDIPGIGRCGGSGCFGGGGGD